MMTSKQFSEMSFEEAIEYAMENYNDFHTESEMKEFDPVLKVFGRITREVMEELNGEEFSEELLYCVKLHLWRKIRYDTEIPVRDIQIINSLKK